MWLFEWMLCVALYGVEFWCFRFKMVSSIKSYKTEIGKYNHFSISQCWKYIDEIISIEGRTLFWIALNIITIIAAIFFTRLMLDYEVYGFLTSSIVRLGVIIITFAHLGLIVCGKSKFLVIYNVVTLLSSIAVSCIINLIFNNYLYEFNILIMLIIWLVLSFAYLPFIGSSYRRQTIKLAKNISNINGKIQQAISILQNAPANITKREYERIRKTVNRKLKAHKIYKTFQPMIKEDKSVLCAITLMDSLSNEDLKGQYNNYKKKYDKINTFQFLEKGNNTKDYVANINNLIDRLSATLNNNDVECRRIQSNQNVTDLYIKYNLKTPERYMNALFAKLIITMSIVIICFIALNVLKMPLR